EANRAQAKTLELDLEIVECAGLETGEKYRQGLHKVATAFCGFCSDSDIVILEGVRRCLDALRDNPAAATAHGHSFSFVAKRDGDFELSDFGSFAADIGHASPVERLGRLFQNYRTARHGIFRTHALQQTFAALEPMSTALGRELSWSALA